MSQVLSATHMQGTAHIKNEKNNAYKKFSTLSDNEKQQDYTIIFYLIEARTDNSSFHQRA